MGKNLRWAILATVVLVGLAIWQAYPLEEKIALGLDLQGGMHLVLRVDTEKLPEEAQKDAVERALEIIRNRIDQFGVREPSIHRQGVDSIIVQLPGITDRERALELIGRTAQLTFHLVSDDPDKIREAVSGNMPAGYELKYLKEQALLVNSTPSLTGDTLVDASVKFDQQSFNQPYVALSFNSEGAKIFTRVTGENINRRLAILLDGNIQSAPVIKSRIAGGQAMIQGSFSFDDAGDLAIVLRAGALPAPIIVEEERTVGPLLGKDSVKSGVQAMAVGGAAVLVFMIIYYMLAGLVANIALALNVILVMGALGYFHATLTLPGIAGLILTIGMAVDANVLIYERIREEFKAGKAIRAAISAGYSKAFRAILDSNVTSLIAAFLLFQFGTGPIRGFAITLSVGLIASMFTALIASRAIFDVLTRNTGIKRLKMLRLVTDTKINFISKRRICYVISAIVIILGMFSFISKGDAVFGIDFTGGQVQQYRFQDSVDVSQVRASLSEAGVVGASIQEFGSDKEIVIKTAEDISDIAKKTFKEQFADNPAQLLRVEKVGPAVGKELRKRAILALLSALAGILIYIAVRFRHLDFGVAGIIAIFHDVLVAVGLLALTGREISLTIVAALLTVAGYSINDTIVIYDRIRENMRTMRKFTLKDVINLSINQTLSRTVLTTITTLLVVIALFTHGGEVLKDFAFVLIVGFISGIYSTIFIASPLVITWRNRKK